MIAQVTAAALVAENKQRAYPASVDSIPTSANQEDHVSMAAHGARRLAPMAENACRSSASNCSPPRRRCDFHAPLHPARRSKPCGRCCAPRSPIWTRTATSSRTSPRRPALVGDGAVIARSAPWRCPR